MIVYVENNLIMMENQQKDQVTITYENTGIQYYYFLKKERVKVLTNYLIKKNRD